MRSFSGEIREETTSTLVAASASQLSVLGCLSVLSKKDFDALLYEPLVSNGGVFSIHQAHLVSERPSQEDKSNLLPIPPSVLLLRGGRWDVQLNLPIPCSRRYFVSHLTGVVAV